MYCHRCGCNKKAEWARIVSHGDRQRMEAICESHHADSEEKIKKAVEALREQIAELQAEPYLKLKD